MISTYGHFLITVQFVSLSILLVHFISICKCIIIKVSSGWCCIEKYMYRNSQEAFLILDIVNRFNLTDCNKSPRASSFQIGFPGDNIAPSTLDTSAQDTLTKCFQPVIGYLNWLSISVHPDTNTIVDLLTSHTHSQS